MHELGYTSSTLALLFVAMGTTYASTAPFIYLVTSRIEKRGVILIGQIILAFSLVLIGDDGTIIDDQYRLVFIVIGFISIGLSASFIAIPCLPEIIDSIEEDKKLNQLYDREILHGVVTGLFVMLQCLGEMIGPVLGSSLAETYGFANAQNLCAAFLFVFSITYFISCGNIQMFKRVQKEQPVQEPKKDNNYTRESELA